MRTLLLPLLTATLLAPAFARAQTAEVYECTGANGQTAFQDTPCSGAQHQKTLEIENDVTNHAPPPPAAPGADTPPPAQDAHDAPKARPAPVKLLYRCVRATDGTTYVSDDGDPQPYLAPLGIVGGMGQQPLAEVYGGKDAAKVGASAPELAPHATPALVGSNYTEVRDMCRQMDAGETCSALQQEYDTNEDKLRNAFDSDKGPLIEREMKLRKAMASCPDADTD